MLWAEGFGNHDYYVGGGRRARVMVVIVTLKECTGMGDVIP